MAGGVFANVKLNQRIAAIEGLKSLWVVPHMGDGGLAVGAALGSIGSVPRQIDDVYWGTNPSPKEIRSALGLAGLSRIKDLEIPEKVAALLANGKVVARCAGAMEWGPRALGNRSILASPFDSSINDWLNERLKRSEFMPFAPVIRSEDADRWFYVNGPLRPHDL